jgi:ribA/ribD-fused uncharacterized protein
MDCGLEGGGMIHDIPPITSFSGSFKFLSNFYRHPFRFDDQDWPTAEHAYQWMKTLDPVERGKIRNAPTPGKAKALGRKVMLRNDWESIRIPVMLQILQAKFRDLGLAEMLILTEPRECIEGNAWGDVFWGQCNGIGENWLGKLLMLVRSQKIAELQPIPGGRFGDGDYL